MRNPINILNIIQNESSINEIKNLKQAIINYNNGAIMSEPISKEEEEITLRFFGVESEEKEMFINLMEPKKFIELSVEKKSELLTNIKDLFVSDNEKIYSITLFSNPNSGKTKYLTSLIENFPKMNLSLKNTKNPTEWHEKIFIKNIKDESFIGPILKMIANSSIFYEIPHFIYEDEVGEFELDFVLGQTVKGILKSDQRIDINSLVEKNEELKNKFEEIKLNKKITLKQYTEIGILLKNECSYEVTMYKYNDLEIPLWFPKNLFFIFTSNYELGMAKSLHDSKGWNNKGKRIYPKHLYNYRINNDIYEDSLVEIKNVDISNIIVGFNNNFLKSIPKVLTLTDFSQEDKEELKSRMYEFLVPNFYQFKSKDINEQKNELNERLTSLLYNFGFQDIESVLFQLIK